MTVVLVFMLVYVYELVYLLTSIPIRRRHRTVYSLINNSFVLNLNIFQETIGPFFIY